MIVRLVTSAIFWLNNFTPSEPGAGLSNTQGPIKLVLGTAMDYKKVLRLYPGKYVQAHQEDAPQNTIDIYQSVRAIVLGPQYNLQGGYF